MRVLGLLALGGAMGLSFEDLSYSKLKSAFSKVSFCLSRSKVGIHGPTGSLTIALIRESILKYIF